MKCFLVVVLWLAAGWLEAQPNPVGIYTYSRDSNQGFKDEHLDTFRRELGKYASPLMELAYSRESAQITVQFLGQGELAIELDTTGKAVRHLWSPDDKARRMWAIVRIGHDQPFSKEFSVAGSGGRDLSRLAKAIGDWLQQNSSIIREP
ncbi:MAG: hypothetical protein BMS9Abin37_3150 [Acidobacteriota bacterium]|nr:MAG: hypothetical protein BMS9Abin37_3150 [Acidobacteriota bacterium]